ncbi:Fc receptor-like protein 5 [Orycteropus afer afer]|uniref:Fc receptor-like protein 5 n=1 Tax=Orycteropus afer afer TaxID=1230840 RepID=A0AC54ZCB1_ORYAF|nr:Fc receptor-like protein 5 [Orycteropus afer afer]
MATTSKPVISLQPPWTLAFQGETVLLTCNGIDSSRKITWYHGSIKTETTGKNFEAHDSGEYRCQIQDSPSSKPVHLQFSSAPLILQVPVSVFQGEPVVLRCRGNKDVIPNSLTIYKDGKVLKNDSEFHIHQASLKNNGEYFCKGIKKSEDFISSNTVKIQVEGSPVILTCEIQLPPQRSDTQIQFRFLRDNKTLGYGWSYSPEYRIKAIWSTGYYSCTVKTVTSNKWKQSQSVQIPVQIPLSQPILTRRPSETKVFEGDIVTFYCEAQKGSLPILYQLYHENIILNKTKVFSSRTVSFSLPLTSGHSGKYYCSAENGLGTQLSRALSLDVKVPVSQPLFTLSSPETKIFEGDKVTFYCEAQRGSFPILYHLHHENVTLYKIQVFRRGPVSFHLSVTSQHSGKYHCSAENGQGVQHSTTVSLTILVPVSQPVLTLRPSETEAFEGDIVTFYCEAQRGSLPIVYQLYHENIILEKTQVFSSRTISFNLHLTSEHSGKYHCSAENELGTQLSKALSLDIRVPVSQPVLTLRPSGARVLEGDLMTLYCKAQRGSPHILYQFYHESVILGSHSNPYEGGASFSLSLTAEHSGNYFCSADNGQGPQRSEAVSLFVTVPLSHPVLTLKSPRAQAVVGDVVELHCEAQRGSPPILYRFYHKDGILRNSSAPSGGGTSFSFSLTEEHSGNYHCTADNDVGAQNSNTMSLNVVVPVSCPVLTLRASRAQPVVGDVVELHCEAWRGSPPILYQFYHEDVTLGNSSSSFGGGVSFNLSLTIEHSGNYSCEADNGLGAQRSEVVTLFIKGLTGSRSGPVATGITGGLLSIMGLAAVALLWYYWFSRKTGLVIIIPTMSGFLGNSGIFVSHRSPSNSDNQEPTYDNVPAWVELQPVYSNVNLKEDVVYSEVQCKREEKTHAVASTPGLLKDKDASIVGFLQFRGVIPTSVSATQVFNP